MATTRRAFLRGIGATAVTAGSLAARERRAEA